MEPLDAPFVPSYATPNYQSYIVKIKNGKKALRDSIIEQLHKEGIAVKKGITAIHKEPYYKEALGEYKLPFTEEANETTFMLPLYPSLKKEEQDFIIDRLRKVCRKL